MFETTHRWHHDDAAAMKDIASESVHLIVTSPPYPMIGMWDEAFGDQDRTIRRALEDGDGPAAWNGMHRILDRIWNEAYRVLRPGGYLCVNVGDATRTVGDEFRLFSNGSRVTGTCEQLGFRSMPPIFWMKPTNSPNKFMGSGMLPGGAYVTLEHEYILLFRKGLNRVFSRSEREIRRRSAYFWEERNRWFSQTWDFRGVRQRLAAGRNRSAAFPVELAYRLIHMYSIQGDTVLDPFLGTGTTTFVAAAAGRNSIGFEIDANLVNGLSDRFEPETFNIAVRQRDRVREHRAFVTRYTTDRGTEPSYRNDHYAVPVITGQERAIQFPMPSAVRRTGDGEWRVTYDWPSFESEQE